jgi:hypothetical protein
MKIKSIGYGNAFSILNGNNSFLLTEEHEGETRNLLIDTGWALPLMLHKYNIPIKSIDDIYISHAHADHASIEFVAFKRYDWYNKPEVAMRSEMPIEETPIIRTNSDYAPNLICNRKLLKDLWKKSWRGGLESIEGQPATLKSFFTLYPIKENQNFIWQGWTVSLIQQIHIMTGSITSPTFGLLFKKEGHKTVYFVTDSQHCSPRQSEIFYKESDIIFQDCECDGVDTVKKIMNFSSKVHANYGELKGYENVNAIRLSDDIKEKMFLDHYQDYVTEGFDFYGQPCDWFKMVKDDGFAGMVKQGQEWIV